MVALHQDAHRVSFQPLPISHAPPLAEANGSSQLRSASVIAVGGPALTWYLMPTEGELFQKFNPELQKRSLEKRPQRQKEFDDFVVKLKEQSKSDKSSKCLS